MAQSSLLPDVDSAQLLKIAAQFAWRCGRDLRVDFLEPLESHSIDMVVPVLRGLRLDRLAQRALYPAERRAFVEHLDLRRNFVDAPLTLSSPDSTPVHLTLSASAISDQSGEFHGYVGVGRSGAERPFDALQRQELVGLLRKAEAARDREQRLRRESEAMLTSLKILYEPLPLAEKCKAILRTFEPLLGCEAAVVVRRGVNGALTVVVSTLEKGEHDLWPDGPIIADALAGRAAVLEDLSADKETSGIDPSLALYARAALFAPLRIGRENAVLIALHRQPGAFGDSHLAIMQRLGLIAAQAFESEENKIALVNASKLATLGELLAAIAHEINQPLSVISMAVQNAKMMIESDAPQSAVLEKLDRSGSQALRAGEIVNAIRGLAHPNRTTGAAVSLSPAEIIQGLKMFTEGTLRAKGIVLELTVPEDCRNVLGHPGGLQQVLLNLIVNARDAVSNQLREQGQDSGGRITVAVEDERTDDTVRILVSDNGGGIPPDVIERIFDPFFTLKEVGKGTGLGLSICQTLISEMGATLSVSNDAEGAVFEIRLVAA